MATGEKSFSSAGREVKKFESTPIAPGEYDLKINAGKWSTVVAQTSNLPYLNGPFEVLDSGKDGGKNRSLYHRLFLSLKPGKDGVAMVDRGGGIVALAKGIGTHIDVPLVQRTNSDGEVVEMLSPKAVDAWLKANDGAIVRAKVKIERFKREGATQFEEKSVVDYFIEGEATEELAGDDEPAAAEDAAEEVEESGADDASTDEADSDEDESPVPPPRRSVKPAPKKVASKPAPKPAKKR